MPTILHCRNACLALAPVPSSKDLRFLHAQVKNIRQQNMKCMQSHGGLVGVNEEGVAGQENQMFKISPVLCWG